MGAYPRYSLYDTVKLLIGEVSKKGLKSPKGWETSNGKTDNSMTKRNEKNNDLQNRKLKIEQH